MKILLGTALALALFLALFDWNWFRGPLESFLAQRSQREVRIGHLNLSFGLNPSVRFRDVYVANAPWSKNDRPLIDAGELVFTLSLRTLWDERRVLSVIVLRDAEVNMEWMTDGRRNWRLTNPDYTGLGRYKVMRLDAVRSSLRFFNHAVGLDLYTAASEPESVQGAQAKFASRIDFKGTYKDRAFTGHAFTGMPLPMQDSNEAMPLLGEMRAGSTRLDVDGRIADFWRPSMIDIAVKLSGPSLSQLHPFVRVALPDTRPYRLDGRIEQSGHEITKSKVRGKVGTSDFRADTVYSRTEPRPKLRADVHLGASKLTDFAVGAEQSTPEGARLFPAAKFKTDGLRAADVDLTLEAKQILAAGMALDDLRLKAALDDGVLQVKPVTFSFLGGKVTAAMNAEDGEGALNTRLTAEVRQLRVEQIPALASKVRVTGPLNGKLVLAGRGDSMATLMASATGSFDASVEGGTLSSLADAKLALDGGRVIAVKLRGDRDIPIQKAAVGIDFSKGMGRVRTLVLDTEQTHLDGAGSVDLKAETVDLVIKPHPKDPTLFSMRGDFTVQGPIRKPAFSLRRGAAAANDGAAAEKRTTATRKE